ATLDTGGWLALTRQGLPPCKIHQASLGALTHDELDKLYWGAGLNAYVAESLLVETDGNGKVAALCCNLLVPPKEEERNPEYLGKLVQCMNKLGLPAPGV
ncbi:MAG: hypothetical protein KZQ99_18000, partial [Candidatus Thiodiazotropha sp. (ex Dulcina madagascariensis)]|nr:hypothetical protein [Candidatus Thiodiazotropha sp. (ex Dulcina madagascariensis)]